MAKHDPNRPFQDWHFPHSSLRSLLFRVSDPRQLCLGVADVFMASMSSPCAHIMQLLSFHDPSFHQCPMDEQYLKIWPFVIVKGLRCWDGLACLGGIGLLGRFSMFGRDREGVAEMIVVSCFMLRKFFVWLVSSLPVSIR